MPRLSKISILLYMVLFLFPCISFETPRSEIYRGHSISVSWLGGLIINHTCIDLESIPEEWIDAAQANIRIHYAHTSHGGQITTGLNRIEVTDSNYSQAQGSRSLPTEEGALCIYDGNGEHSYITPDLYWSTTEGLAITQATIDANPTFNVSLWSWCCQLTGYSEEQTQDYLNAMTSLEEANPHIIFVYMTNNAQATGAQGYNRWLRNQQIRQYCLENDKVLFDFADLDCWSNGVNSSYEYTVDDITYNIPVEHHDFNGNEAGHTTYSSCEQKGRAFWWLMVMLAGWNSPPPTTTPTTDMTTTLTTTTSEAPTSGETTTSSTTNGGSEQLGSEILIISAGVVAVLVIVLIIYKRK